MELDFHSVVKNSFQEVNGMVDRRKDLRLGVLARYGIQG